MADNSPITPGTGLNVASDEVSYSGDTTQVQIVQLGLVTGSEGSRTLAKVAAGSELPVKSGGFVFTTTVEKTRPADTNAYIANDCVAEATSGATVWTFAVARTATGSGTINGAFLQTDDAADVSRMEIDLYDDTITAINDNAEATRLYTNAAKYIGTITFPALVKKTTNSTSADAEVRGLAMPFICVGSSSIYGIVRKLDADTPVSGAKYSITLCGYQD
jgi:hypothetical protein